MKVWEGMQESLKFFFHYKKSKSRIQAHIGPYTDKNNKVMQEKPCEVLNQTYFEVYEEPSPE